MRERDGEGRRTLLLILIVAFLARMVAVLILHRLDLGSIGNELWMHARSVYDGTGFGFDWYGLFDHPVVGSFVPPLYPGLLAAALLLSGGRDHSAVILAQLVNATLATATVYLVARLALFVSGGQAAQDTDHAASAGHDPSRLGMHLSEILHEPGLLAAAAWAIYLPALGQVGYLTSAVLEGFLFCLLAFFLLRASATREQSGSLRNPLLAGLALGLLLLARPTAGIIWGLWALVLLWRSRFGASRVRTVLLVSAAALLVITPWTVRNAHVHHRLVPISTNGGFNFYIGSNPIYGGGIPPLHRLFPRMSQEEQQRLRSLTEVERDRYLYTMGLTFWREQPGAVLSGIARKLVSFVFWRSYLFYGYPRWLAVTFIVTYLLLLIPFAVSVVRCRGPACTLLLLAIVATGVLCCIYVVSMRFRASVEPFMVAIAAGTLVRRR